MGWWRPLAHVYALGVIMIGWVLFRASTLAHAVGILRAMAGLRAAEAPPWAWGTFDAACGLAFAAGVIGSMPGPALLERAVARVGSGRMEGLLPLARAGCLLLVLVASAMRLAAGTHNLHLLPVLSHEDQGRTVAVGDVLLVLRLLRVSEPAAGRPRDRLEKPHAL